MDSESCEPSLAIEGLSRPDWEHAAFSVVRDATDYLNTQELGLPERTEREVRERILLAQARFGASTAGLRDYEVNAEKRKRDTLLTPGLSASVACPNPSHTGSASVWTASPCGRGVGTSNQSPRPIRRSSLSSLSFQIMHAWNSDNPS